MLNSLLRWPYHKGMELTLRTITNFDFPAYNDDLILCEITEYLNPTFSCLMKVKVLGQETEALLKLFDRRFAPDFRYRSAARAATSASEEAFVNFFKSAECSEFLHQLRDDDDYREPAEGWDLGRVETYLYDQCLDMYDSETRAYRILKKLQGNQVPKILAEVGWWPGSLQDISTSVSPTESFYEIKGVLLELIDGYALSEMAEHTPEEDWDRICSDAIEVQRQIDEYPIRNEIVGPSNFRVTRLASTREYRVVMLDFELCEFREEDESDEEWGRAKWRQDEEGALGRAMQERLKERYDHHWQFRHSSRFAQWAVKDDEDELDNLDGVSLSLLPSD